MKNAFKNLVLLNTLYIYFYYSLLNKKGVQNKLGLRA